MCDYMHICVRRWANEIDGIILFFSSIHLRSHKVCFQKVFQVEMKPVEFSRVVCCDFLYMTRLG